MPSSIVHPDVADPSDAPVTEDPVLEASRRVVLIDPRPDRRALMALLVEQCPGLRMVGMAANLEQAETEIREYGAHVAIVEIQMPVEEGLRTIQALHDEFPDLRIVVCSFHDDAATREAALTHGADAYLNKPLSARDLFDLAIGPHPDLVGSATP
jgi:DNA-binding NarL/FixJ family response regulator